MLEIGNSLAFEVIRESDRGWKVLVAQRLGENGEYIQVGGAGGLSLRDATKWIRHIIIHPPLAVDSSGQWVDRWVEMDITRSGDENGD